MDMGAQSFATRRQLGSKDTLRISPALQVRLRINGKKPDEVARNLLDVAVRLGWQQNQEAKGINVVLSGDESSEYLCRLLIDR